MWFVYTHTCIYIYICIYMYMPNLSSRIMNQVTKLISSQTALILRGILSTRCWKHSSEVLVHIDMTASHSCCRCVGCTSMMPISRSTTSQSCSVGLRSGDWRPLAFRELVVMLNKPVSDDMSSVTRCIILLEAGQQQYSGRLQHLNDARLVLRGPKKENIPPHHHYTSSLNRWYEAEWI